jgi:hypothetical protein
MNFAQIQRELDYYKKFVPTNFSGERTRFFEHFEKRESYNPIFNYNDTLTLRDYEDIKDVLKKAKGTDLVINEFLRLYMDIVDTMVAWKQNNYEDLSIISGKIFGSTDEFDINQTIREYKKLNILTDTSMEVYNDEQIGKKFLAEFKKRKFRDWSVDYDEASGGNVSIYESEKKVVIRTGTVETRIGLECTLSHELDGHAMQAFNAMSNKKYRKWFLSYLGTEKQYEGYATFVVINNLSISHIISELIYNYILIIATAQAQTASFYQTFQVIYDLCQDKNFSFSAAYKAKRGFQDTAQAGCFQKENAYVLGALDIIKLIEESKDNYYSLSQGCFPLAANRFVTSQKPKWINVKDFNKENLDYFKRKLKIILIT